MQVSERVGSSMKGLILITADCYKTREPCIFFPFTFCSRSVISSVCAPAVVAGEYCAVPSSHQKHGPNKPLYFASHPVPGILLQNM